MTTDTTFMPSPTACTGTTMRTITGAMVDLRQFRPADISLLDIAHALACINRFTGHTQRPYSVAEHSLLVERLMLTRYGISCPSARLAALLHDAHEAYIGDISTPFKRTVGWALTDREQAVQHVVLGRFGVWQATVDWGSVIKRCDLIALATEKRDLLAAGGPDWPDLAGVEPCQQTKLREQDGMGWQDWRQAFLDRFSELHYAVHGCTVEEFEAAA